MSDKLHTVKVRFSKHEHEALREMAKRERRTVSAQIGYMVVELIPNLKARRNSDNPTQPVEAE